MINRIAIVFERVFAVDPESVTQNTTSEDIARWDSVGHMNLVAALESEFGVQLDIDAIMTMTSVGKIVELLRNKGAGG